MQTDKKHFNPLKVRKWQLQFSVDLEKEIIYHDSGLSFSVYTMPYPANFYQTMKPKGFEPAGLVVDEKTGIKQGLFVNTIEKNNLLYELEANGHDNPNKYYLDLADLARKLWVKPVNRLIDHDGNRIIYPRSNLVLEKYRANLLKNKTIV